MKVYLICHDLNYENIVEIIIGTKHKEKAQGLLDQVQLLTLDANDEPLYKKENLIIVECEIVENLSEAHDPQT